MINNTRVLKSS